MFIAVELRVDIGHDTGKPTQSIATPSKDDVFTTADRKDVVEQEAGKPMPVVTMSPHDTHGSRDKKQDRRRASRLHFSLQLFVFIFLR